MSAINIRKMSAREKSSQKIALKRKQVLRTLISMVEESVDEGMLLENCKILSKSDFEDLNVERSLILICGYPICNNALQSFAKQKYKISLKNHKVYDLTERKLFCSDICFTASTFLKKQLRDEPFWLSDENETSKILELYKDKCGDIGTEVKLRDVLTGNDCEPTKAKETKPRSIRKPAGLYFPYVREDQMEQLKKSMSTLTIREKPL